MAATWETTTAPETVLRNDADVRTNDAASGRAAATERAAMAAMMHPSVVMSHTLVVARWAASKARVGTAKATTAAMARPKMTVKAATVVAKTPRKLIS